jgi:dinuclear metal center YbgI/SA1388 family protein
VAAEAIRERAELIVTHHPVMFRPLQRLTADDSQGALLLDLIAARCAIYSPHTSYDSAPQGINQQLAEQLELTDIAPLRRRPAAPQVKIVTFVPDSHREAVQQALWNSAAGRIGEYTQCSFFALGTGTFLGSAAAHPTVGKSGQFEQTEELRLEVVCPAGEVSAAVSALRAAHPYEEPAIDVYPLQAFPSAMGAGRSGTLPRELALSEFVALVKLQWSLECVGFAGDSALSVRRVAIACGSAAEFLPDAAAQDCQVLLTGEARFHDCVRARELGLGLVLAGHYATERPGVERLAGILGAEFPGLTAWASQSESDPLQWT